MTSNGEALIQLPRVARARPWCARQVILPASISADFLCTENDAFHLPAGTVRAHYGENTREGELIAWRLDGDGWTFVRGGSDL